MLPGCVTYKKKRSGVFGLYVSATVRFGPYIAPRIWVFSVSMGVIQLRIFSFPVGLVTFGCAPVTAYRYTEPIGVS